MTQLPQPFISRIKETHADAAQFLEALGREPWLSVRLNPIKGQKADDEILASNDMVKWCKEGRYLQTRPQFTLMPSFHAGAFYVQEASSMFLKAAISAVENMLPSVPVCLDLCAAPGGKATLLMSKMAERGIVVANEVIRNRAWILRENVCKWGLPGAIVCNKSPEEITQSGQQFDLVTIDAPCSGEGMFRKDDTAIAEWSPKAAADCALRQRKILSDIWPAIRTGGFIIYSTCTFNPAENEENMAWAIETLGAENIPIPLPSDEGITTISYPSGEGYAFYPHKLRGEGFFLSLLRKTSDDAPSPRSATKKRNTTKISIKETTEGRELTQGLKTYIFDNEIFGFPADRASQMAQIAQALQPILTGTPIGSIAGKKGFAPAPELPLSTAYAPDSLPTANVDKITALKFLHGDTDLNLNIASEGWTSISYNNLYLGFVKTIGRRLNNYYPKEWRIRMAVK